MTDDAGTIADGSAALPPGSKVDRYEIISLLKLGRQAISYSARDLQLGRDVVIKEYFPADLARRQGTAVGLRSPDAANDFTDGLARFVADGHALENPPDAPAVERVLALFEANGTEYVVSELVNNEARERRARLPANTAAPAETVVQAKAMRRWRPFALAMAAAAVVVLAIGILAFGSPFGPAGGRYGGRYVGVVQIGTANLVKLDLAIAGTSGSGSVDTAACGVVPISVAVSDHGHVTGRVAETSANCGGFSWNIIGEFSDATLDLAFSCDTCTDTFRGSLVRFSAAPRTYDGTWSVVHVCSPVGDAQGSTNRYTMTVKDGYAFAQRGTRGQPESLTFAGQVRSDGAVAFVGYGRVGARPYILEGQTEGMPFAFAADGRLSGSEGRATATVARRDCTLTFAKTGS